MDKIFLSPHFDDVALACGGIVATATAAGERVLIATVCAAVPPAHFHTPFMDSVHVEAGFADGEEYVVARREEDREACAVLGAEYEWGPSLDAIYRHPNQYGSWAALHGRSARNDCIVRQAVAFIVSLARRYPKASLYFPAGMSGHIDHCAVNVAAVAKAGMWRETYMYEDWSVQSGPLFKVKFKTAPIINPTSPAARAVWVKAALCYRSQLKTLFGSAARAEASMNNWEGTQIWRV